MIQNVCPYIFWYTIRIMPRPALSQTDKLLRLARRGPVRARDLEQIGVPRAYLKRLRERGLLDQVDRGLYRLAVAPMMELSSLAEATRRVPHATVCLLSALQVHALTTEVPHAVWLMIDRHARKPQLASLKLEIVRASGAALTHGTEKRSIDGVKVVVTTPAKTVADCFRFRRHVGLDVALAALKDYRAKRKGSIDELVAAARADRIYAFMRPYVEALA
jgi:predicted transcriptional regulator of viral defense system